MRTARAVGGLARQVILMAYERRLGNIKPDAVYFDGADCPFYIEEEA